MRLDRRVVVQVSLGNLGRLSSWLPVEDPETPEQSKSRKDPANATTPLWTLPPTESVDVSELTEFLRRSGLVLSDCVLQKRINYHRNGGPKDGRPKFYYVARFTFEESRDVPEVFVEVLDGHILPHLNMLLRGALWKVRAYCNPSKDGNGHWFSVNIEHRANDGAKPNGRLALDDNGVLVIE